MKKGLIIFTSILVFCSIVIFGFLYIYGKNFGKHHRTNHFIEGEFVGVNESNNEEVFTFTVTLISKEEFNLADGINVVHDQYKDLYFILELYYQVSNNEEKTYITFNNLIGSGTPLKYVDDLDIEIYPLNKPKIDNKDYEPDYQLSIFKSENLETRITIVLF